MSLDDYKLSCELLGHSLDVRAVTEGRDCIISGSRDKTAKVWQHNGTGYVESLTLQNHKNFVSSVCVLDGGEWICTGSNDATICVYAAGNIEPFTVLKGHTSTVCALTAGLESGILLSGSWDKTARVWRIAGFGDASSITLEGHEAAVWAVAVLPSGKYVTGSADKNIIYWSSSGEKLKVLKGHKDCVRGLLTLSNDGLISAGNDAVIKIWTDDGECVRELSGHTNYIYSLAFNKHLGEGVFVSGGEDSTIRLWNLEGPLGEELTLPAQSVWSVACLKNGDIVTGTSDGVVRVFTKDPKRALDDQTLSAYTSAVETRKMEALKQLGGVNVNDLPGPEVLLQKGREDQTKMVRHPDGKIICYQYANGKWNALGDVVGAAGGTQASSGKTLFEGKEYDYVFSVDISDTSAPLKLPYNRGEDPWLGAQKFIHRHELPQAYLDQVANFIIKNSSNAPIIESAPSGYEDPFTGGGRYVPGSGSDFSSGGGNVDPFTGGSSYTAQSQSGNFGLGSDGRNVDPFTGASSYSSQSQQPNVNVNFNPVSGANVDPFTGGSSHTTGPPKESHFPFNNYHLLDVYDPAKILIKLKEFNGSIEDASLRVSDDVLGSVVNLASFAATDESVKGLHQLFRWPTEKLFPVLDVTRLACRAEHISSQIITPHILAVIIEHIGSIPANQLMSIRCLSNIICDDYGRGIVGANLIQVIAALNQIKNGSANLQIAIGTFYLNASAFQTEKPDQNACHDLNEGIIEFLKWATDLEANYRGYRALGNLLTTPHGHVCGAQIVSVDAITEKLREHMNGVHPHGFEKINEITRDIINTL